MPFSLRIFTWALFSSCDCLHFLRSGVVLRFFFFPLHYFLKQAIGFGMLGFALALRCLTFGWVGSPFDNSRFT